MNIANRAILNAAATFILYNGLMAIIYELVLQGKLLGLQAVLTKRGKEITPPDWRDNTSRR